MTNLEQRLAALEAAVFKTELPMNDRQASDNIYRDPNNGGRITSIRRGSDGRLFSIDEEVRVRDSVKLTICEFIQACNGCFAKINAGPINMTVPLCDLIPLTTGGASADWLQKHGVKEWEITAFRATSKHPNAPFLERPKTEEAIRCFFESPYSVASGHWEIYEVKRLSDGTLWKLGDEIATPEDGIHSIGAFIITGGVMCARFSIGDIQLSYLSRPSGKEWEIVEFRPTGKDEYAILPYVRNDKGLFNHPGNHDGNWSEEDMLNDQDGGSVADGSYLIHSVRRLSDSVLFTIGDKIDYPNNMYSPGGCAIDQFSIYEDQIFVNQHYLGTPQFRIKDWIKCEERKPIFTTADGIEAFESSDIFVLQAGNGIEYSGKINNMPAEMVAGHARDRAYSTRAAAEAAYNEWLYQQPVLTIADLNNIPMPVESWSKVKALVKEKLAKK